MSNPTRCNCTSVVFDIDCPIHGEWAAGMVANAKVLIQAEVDGRCESCGSVEETRPYGPNGEEVCFACGMKDEGAAKAAFEGRFK